MVLVGLCLISFALSARQTIWYFSLPPSYSDLRIFMTGISMVRSGQAHELYQFPAQLAAQVQLYPETRVSGLLPFNHLAFELLMYWPISRLPYSVALVVWAMINLGVILLISHLLKPYTQAIAEVTGIPIALYVLAFYPVVYVLGEGQDSLIFLLLIVLSLRAMDSQRMFLAGFLLALGCFKLHLALLMGFFVFLLGRKWRGVAGCAAGGSLAAAVSLAVVGPTMFTDYLAMLRQQEVMTPWGFFPFFMPNIRGFFRWTLRTWLEPGQILPVIFMASVIVGIIAAWLIVRARVRDSALLYAVAVLTTVLISYHLHVQDLSMAILPILVIADWTLRHRITQSKFLKAWTAVLALSLAALYGYRFAAEPFMILLFRSCYLAVPVFLLWIVGLRVFCEDRAMIPVKTPAETQPAALATVSGA
jgi:Glycosyltransferase family 87